MTHCENSSKFEDDIKNIQQNVAYATQFHYANFHALLQLKDLILDYQTIQLQARHSNPLNRFGKKCFSQTDEDGLTLEIIRRLGIDNGVYAEFGVGDGLENNTIILSSVGWKGFWVGGEELAFNYASAKKFKYFKDWITLENIVSYAKNGLALLGEKELDLVSMDLDGNDIYFAEELLLQNFRPKLFIVEYNAKFIPPSRFQIKYNPQHRWSGDDYFGAALINFVDMFKKHNYELICCNSHTGANAFFIRKDYSHLFLDVPKNIGDIYAPPRYHLYSGHGHKASARVVEEIINQ